jgi:hypothetical protein
MAGLFFSSFSLEKWKRMDLYVKQPRWNFNSPVAKLTGNFSGFYYLLYKMMVHGTQGHLIVLLLVFV